MKIAISLPKIRTAFFAVLIFVFLFPNIKDIYAQWQPIAKFNGFITCIYSIDNDSVIFVGAGDNLWRSSDFGKSWIPLGLQGVSSIQFKDGLHGWLTQLLVSVRNNQYVGTPNTVLRTSDAGLTWASVYPDSALPNSILYQPASQKLFLLQWDKFPSAVSTDDGNTWQNIAPYNLNRNGMTFTNDHHGVITMVNNATVINGKIVQDDTVLVTDDDGLTWKESVMGQETWQPVAIPGTDTVIAFGENPRGGGDWPLAWTVNRSTDGGYTWVQPKTEPNFFNTGDNLWCDCGSVIVTQSSYYWDSNSKPMGIVISTDIGDTWASIGGPTHWAVDTRFFYSGQYIYAGDSNSDPTTLWRYAVHHYPTITYPANLQTCSHIDTSFHISFSNTCFGIPASLDSFALSGSPAFSLQPLATPHTLANEEDIALHYNPIPSARDTALLHLYFNQHGDRKDTILQFTGAGPQPDYVSLRCVLSASHAAAGKTFSVDIFPDQSINNAGLDTISFSLNYTNDLLNFVPTGSSSIGQISVQNGEASIPISIIGNNLTLDPTKPIVTLTFEAMLSDTLHTTLAISEPKANPSHKSYGECVLSLTADSTPFNLDLVCGDSLILAAMQGAPPFSIVSIQPNPASSSIEVNLSKLSPVAYSLFDALGHSVLSGTDTPQKLDVTFLPSGGYYIRLNSNGYVQTRKIEIKR